MVFSSTLFLLYFLPIFLVIYVLLRGETKNVWILTASIFFYAWGAPVFVYLLLASTIVDFYLVGWMVRAESLKRKRTLLVTSILLNLGLLAYFKYANFFVDNVNDALESLGFSAVSWTEVALPIGISFYTFQTLTYSIDIYRGVAKPLRYLHHYLLYILSFPQMIAGPIVRYNDVAEQIVSRPDSVDDKIQGFLRFCIGLAKKVIIANALGDRAHFIAEVNPDHLQFLTAWVGILAYTFQIYFDFSGYSDMAIGLGRMLGFRFPENFNNPYNARSITEFWRRWHITLSTWMRDYVYIPLGGSRTSTQMRLYVNLWLVFLISGLWHGASWNFVIWGAYHGFFLVLERLFFKKVLDKIGVVPSVLLTFFIVMIGWVFFWIESWDHALGYIRALFSFKGGDLPPFTAEFWVMLVLATVFAFSGLTRIGRRMETALYADRFNLWSQVGLLAFWGLIFLVCVASVTATGFNPFIYFRF